MTAAAAVRAEAAREIIETYATMEPAARAASDARADRMADDLTRFLHLSPPEKAKETVRILMESIAKRAQEMNGKRDEVHALRGRISAITRENPQADLAQVEGHIRAFETSARQVEGYVSEAQLLQTGIGETDLQEATRRKGEMRRLFDNVRNALRACSMALHRADSGLREIEIPLRVQRENAPRVAAEDARRKAEDVQDTKKLLRILGIVALISLTLFVTLLIYHQKLDPLTPGRNRIVPMIGVMGGLLGISLLACLYLRCRSN